jgi:hypothetical protein
VPIEATVSIRHDFDDTVETVDWELSPATLPNTTAPWRTFRWRYGQRHYSGCYWFATHHDHVIYESRLERTKLIYADFDLAVSHVVAQPFLIEAVVSNKRRRHIPDFFLSGLDGPTVVDVKPAARLEDPKVAFTLAWTRRLVEERGWRYEIWTEPAPGDRIQNKHIGGPRRHTERGTPCARRRSARRLADRFAGRWFRRRSADRLERRGIIALPEAYLVNLRCISTVGSQIPCPILK